MNDPITVFEMPRADDVEVEISLAMGWARAYESVRVEFTDAGELGQHVALVADGGETLLPFPWYDHAEEMLCGYRASALPDLAWDEGAWDDFEHGWWGSIRLAGERVYIAVTDFDALVDVPGAPALAMVRPGVVDAGGVEIRWVHVPWDGWERAWADARARAREMTAGRPKPRMRSWGGTLAEG